MAVRIRLKRTGNRNNACYRVVVADARSQRDGRAIEELGYYDPKHSDEKLNLERAEYWISQGAKPSETVQGIIDRVKAGKTLTVPEKKVSKKAEAAKEAAKDAAPAESAPAEEAK